jgi:hypothetical protein
MIEKQYVKSRKVWKITFELPTKGLPEGIEIENAFLAGEFNDWAPTATPMTPRKKDGAFRATVELEPGEYQFRYVINGEHWYNDQNADGYVPSGFGEHNCVVAIPI